MFLINHNVKRNYNCTLSNVSNHNCFEMLILKLTLLTASGKGPPVLDLNPRSLAYFSVILQSFAK